MKRRWTKNELESDWKIWPHEEPLIKNKRGATRLGYAILLKFFQHEGRFPSTSAEVPFAIVAHLARQVSVKIAAWFQYPWSGRSIEYHRANIRLFCGFREATMEDGYNLETWLVQGIRHTHVPEHVRDAAFEYCRSQKIEPPGSERIKRIISDAINRQETLLCETFFNRLSPVTVKQIEALIQVSQGETMWTAWQDLVTPD